MEQICSRVVVLIWRAVTRVAWVHIGMKHAIGKHDTAIQCVDCHIHMALLPMHSVASMLNQTAAGRTAPLPISAHDAMTLLRVQL